MNDRLTDCTNEIKVLRYNAALDSLELAACRDALSQAEALHELTEARLLETVAQVDRCEVRELELENALIKASKRGKRWRFIAAMAAVVAVVESALLLAR